MFDRIIRFSLRNRAFVVAAAILVLVYGSVVIGSLPIDVLPDLNRPTVTVMTEAGGLAPEDVERRVTFPIETALNGASGVKRLRSTSGVGLSVVTVEFDWGSNILVDRQIVAERLNLVQDTLPAGVRPVMGPISSIMGEILLIGLVSDRAEVGPMALRTLADWTLRPRLLTVTGVSQVIPIGGEVRNVEVRVSPIKLASYGLTLREVEEAAGLSQATSTGGFLVQGGREYVVPIQGRTTSLAEIAATVVAVRKGTPIRLAQVADVVESGPPVKRGDAGVDGLPAVILSVQKQPGANTVTLTGDVMRVLDEIQGELPEGVTIRTLFRQADFIQHAVSNVRVALQEGAVLVIIVLVLFLMSLRTTLITLTAIPLSFLVTALVFKAFDLSINTMTLGGLAVALGELVDDAIIDVENVYRRLRENRARPDPEPALRVVFRASSEVRNSIVFATVIVVLVFLPLFALSGIEGRLFAPLGIAYTVSIVASLFVSLTVTPALCSLLLARGKLLEHKDSLLVRLLKRGDRRLLGAALKRPWIVMGTAALLVLGAGATVPFLGGEFLPQFNEGTATVNVLGKPGISLEDSDRLGRAAERLMLSVPEVKSVGRRTGRAELDEHAEGVHYSEIDVDFHEGGRPRDIVLAEIRRKLDLLPSVSVNIGQPISHRLDHLLSGVRAEIVVKIYGTDLAGLRSSAATVQDAMRGVPGVVDLQVEKQVLVPELKVTVDRRAAGLTGVRPGELADSVASALAGEQVSEVLDGAMRYPLLVRLDESARSDPDRIGRLLVDTPAAGKVPLSSLARVASGRGPNQILREDVQRRIAVLANVQGRDLQSTAQDVAAAVSKVPLPEGSFFRVGGQFESKQAATRLIAILALASLGGMFVVLYSHFKSVAIVLQVLLNIPLALVGSVFAVWLTGGVMSVATLVGFITLCGIASRNTIMMISHYLHLVREEGESFDVDMIVRGSLERLVPVLMTALTAALGLIPLALAAGEPGKEILTPVATVILGGLISSTLLDMVVTPVVFYRFGRAAVERPADVALALHGPGLAETRTGS